MTRKYDTSDLAPEPLGDEESRIVRVRQRHGSAAPSHVRVVAGAVVVLQRHGVVPGAEAPPIDAEPVRAPSPAHIRGGDIRDVCRDARRRAQVEGRARPIPRRRRRDGRVVESDVVYHPGVLLAAPGRLGRHLEELKPVGHDGFAGGVAPREVKGGVAWLTACAVTTPRPWPRRGKPDARVGVHGERRDGGDGDPTQPAPRARPRSRARTRASVTDTLCP